MNNILKRRDFLKQLGGLTAAGSIFGPALLTAKSKQSAKESQKKSLPNIILMMADDMGYGDPGFNGNKIIKTPNLDAMAENGSVLTSFHSSCPVCSPTRGTFITGRHYHRYGIWSANVGHLPKQEITISEILKEKGYRTGHFGKWHLGTLSKTVSAKGPKRKPKINYSPPAWHGYDRSFVTESAVGTWDPGYGKRAANNPFYDDGTPLDPDKDNNLRGGAARVIVDRAVPFIEKSLKDETPFLAIIWFHAPHEDIMAGPKYLDMYKKYGDAAHYYGCITELDEQVGRLRTLLKKTGVADNTLLWFTSDNGPEGKNHPDKVSDLKGRRYGTTSGLRGRKRATFEGGIRVPTVVEWPSKIKAGTRNDTPMSTLDYLPTIANMVNYSMSDKRPIDGENILDIVEGKRKNRSTIIPFLNKGNSFGSMKGALIDGKYKFHYSTYKDEPDMVFDMEKDREEKHNIAEKLPGKVTKWKMHLEDFNESCRRSHSGADYGDADFQPVGKYLNVLEMKENRKTKNKKNKKNKK